MKLPLQESQAFGDRNVRFRFSICASLVAAILPSLSSIVSIVAILLPTRGVFLRCHEILIPTRTVPLFVPTLDRFLSRRLEPWGPTRADQKCHRYYGPPYLQEEHRPIENGIDSDDTVRCNHNHNHNHNTKGKEQNPPQQNLRTTHLALRHGRTKSWSRTLQLENMSSITIQKRATVQANQQKKRTRNMINRNGGSIDQDSIHT